MRAAVLSVLLALPGMALGPAQLSAADNDYPVGQARFGAFLIPVPLDVQAADDLVPGQGMLVVATRPGGTAASLGLQAGDVVTQLNGTPINHWGDVRAVVRGVQAGDTAQVQVATSDGATSQLNGAFQPRQPGRWFPNGGQFPGQPGAPGGPGGPPMFTSPAAQMAQLLAQQQTLGDLGQTMAALRAAYAASDAETAAETTRRVAEARLHPWAIEVAIDAPTPGPVAAVPVAAAAAGAPKTPSAVTWAVEIAIGNP